MFLGCVMKKLILGSLLLAVSASASADVIMSGFQPWFVVNGNLDGADVADLSGKTQRGQNFRMMSAHYFAKTVAFKVGQGEAAQTKTADFRVSIKDYQCNVPYSVRERSDEYYMISGDLPVYSTGIKSEATFKVQPRNSVDARVWDMVCKNTRPASVVPVTNFVPGRKYNISHEMVIGPLRQQIEAARQQAATQAPSVLSPVPQSVVQPTPVR